MRYLLFLLLLISSVTYSQSNVDFRGDSARFYKNGGSMEVVIRNSTKDRTNGVLVNTGNGVTSFLKYLNIDSISAFRGKFDHQLVLPDDTLSYAPSSIVRTTTRLLAFAPNGNLYKLWNGVWSLVGAGDSSNVQILGDSAIVVNDDTLFVRPIQFETDLAPEYAFQDGDTIRLYPRQYAQDSLILNQYVSKEGKSAWIDRLRADSLFAAITSKDQILYAGANGKILGNATFTRDSASGFVSIKSTGTDALGLYRTSTPSAGTQVGTLLFGANLSGGYNDFAEIRAHYEGNSTTRAGRLVLGSRTTAEENQFGIQMIGAKSILGNNSATAPFGSSIVTIRTSGTGGTPGVASPLSVTNLDSSFYFLRMHTSGRSSFGKVTDNGVGKVQIGGKLTIDTVSTGSASDSILVIIGNEVKKVSPVDFGGGTGTVTSVASGYGLSGGPITGIGTLLVDTSLLSTRLRLQKVADSLGALLGLVSESSTSLKAGTGSSFFSTPTKGAIFGQNAIALGQFATVFGYNSRAAQGHFVIGYDNFPSTTPPAQAVTIGQGITTQQALSIAITPTLTAVNSYGGVMIGAAMNVTASSASNTGNNGGVYIGRGITHTGATYAAGVILGRNNNGRNSNNPVLIGDQLVTEDGLQASVGIGPGAQLLDGQPNAVSIGRGATSYLDPTYGSTGGSQIAIGDSAKAGSWRAAAIGAFSNALAVSSTAIGFGTYANQSHGVVIGRGGYNDVGASVLLYASGSTPAYYFGQPSAAWLNPAMPSGGEAVDWSTQLNAGTYVTRMLGTSGRDARTSPSLTNVRGGHLRMIGGLGTGTAQGGDLQFAVSLAGGVSNNTENTETVVGRFSAANGFLGLLTASPSSVLDITGANGYAQLRLRTSYTPTSTADSNGSTGDVAWDDDYIYIKTSAGWKRTALTSF